jgi:hypothetical protein
MFFSLRDVNIEDLISKAIQGKTKAMLAKSELKSRRILEDGDITSLFGVETK